MQIYAEAESNANSFALACFVRRRREALDSRIQRAEHVMQAVGLVLPRREQYFCRRQIAQKPRAEQTNLFTMVAAPYSFPTVRLIVPRAVSRVVFRAVPGVSFPNTALRLTIFNPIAI